MQGRVTKSTGSWYVVMTEDGQTINCRIKGKFRLDDLNTTNPVAVGDVVVVEHNEQDKDWVIVDIKPRANYLIRQAPRHEKARHILAANIDQALIVIAISQPRTSTGFIDRFLVMAESQHIPTTIAINKQDIHTEKDLIKQEKFLEIYKPIGYDVRQISAQTKQGVEELKGLLRNKTTLVAGHSGVGKSSLLNALEPGLQVKTKEISRKFKKGLHSTTYVELHKLTFGGFLIDSPGIKELGVIEMDPWELSHYFIEMRKYLPKCKYNNCLHLNEPDCGVIEAVHAGEIHSERYINYLMILDSIKDQKHY